MHVSVNVQNTILFIHPSNMILIIFDFSTYLEIAPVSKSSAFIPPFFMISDFTSPCVTKSIFGKFEIFLLHHKMEDIDEHLLIADIEVSCWKDQLKQVVSQLHTTNTFHAMQSIFSKINFVTSKPYLISYPILFLGICRDHVNISARKYCFIQSRSKKGGLRSTPTAYNQRPDSLWQVISLTSRD